MSELRFVLKNLAAEEVVLHTGADMLTLGDLRHVVMLHWLVPEHLQIFTSVAGVFKQSQPNSLSLLSVLKGTAESMNQERIIWIHWMRDTDYMAVYRGGMFLESELEAKREHIMRTGGPFEYVTLRVWRMIAERTLAQWEEYAQGAGTA